MNKKVMGKAGYFGKIVTLLTRSLSLSKDISNCGTSHGVKLKITSKTMIDKLYGRYYRLEGEKEVKLLFPEKSKDLLGKTIILRSPITCGLKDCVCQKCYGHNANLNYDIADGISAFGSEEVSKVINQSILSAKHLLTTVSEKIVFNDVFNRFFNIISGEITPKLDENEDINDYAIYIDSEEVEKIEEFDDDAEYNTMITSGHFYICNIKTGERLEIQEEKGKELFLTEKAVKMYNSGNGWIKFKDLDNDSTLFIMDVLNNELTKPLYEIMDLLNKSKKDQIETIDSITQKMIELLIESKIPAYAVQAELIINRLIRLTDSIMERPNFLLDEIPDYSILTVSKALEKNPSSTVSLSFQELKRQFMSDELFYDKTSSGYLDPFFKKKVKNTIKNHKKKKGDKFNG